MQFEARVTIDIPEKVRGTIHFEADDHPPLAGSLYFKYFNYRSIPALDAPHDILVYFESIFCGLLQEDLVRYCADVGLAVGATVAGRLIGKVAFRAEVATELLGRAGRD
jgi:hypothetical protein